MLKVGFVGVGVMGGPMAANIIRKGGYELTVYDISPEAVAKLVKLGAKAAATPKEVGAASDIVVTMLPEPKHVEEVVLGKDGIAAGLKTGGMLIEMSTIDPITSKKVGDELRKRGFEMVDSPVGKTSEHAVSGTMTLMIGGNPAAIERAMPVLNCMGTDKFMCGGPSMGHAMKTTNNVLATSIMVASVEALSMGVKCGLTIETMIDVMKTTMAWNNQIAVALPKKGFLGDDSPGFMVKLACKDVRLAVELAKAQGSEALVGKATQTALERAMEQGYANRDTAALLLIKEKELGVTVRPAANVAELKKSA
jgi:4-hydroxybutyrate dehydrogenase / sulfolactaldehyde 3-reductase